MAKLLKEDENFIRNNFENAEEILKKEDLNDILDELFAWINEYGLDKDFCLNNKGEEAERVYDSILTY